MSRSMAAELAPRGIRINVVARPTRDTGFYVLMREACGCVRRQSAISKIDLGTPDFGLGFRSLDDR
jgi:NAD(P)-dependent dehydrogenase (short-subunit alcohol dehydrogenase family)